MHMHSSSINLNQNDIDITIPAYLTGDYSDYLPLQLTNQDIETFRSLHVLSSENIFEYGRIMYENGETNIMTNHMKNMVRLPVEEIDHTNLRVYHSHTNDTPPSSQDFFPLTLLKVSQIGVIARNGDIWIVKPGSGYRPSVNELKDTIHLIKEEVDTNTILSMNSIGFTTGELNYISIRECFFRISREFKWDVYGGSIYEMQQLQ